MEGLSGKIFSFYPMTIFSFLDWRERSGARMNFNGKEVIEMGLNTLFQFIRVKVGVMNTKTTKAVLKLKKQ